MSSLGVTRSHPGRGWGWCRGASPSTPRTSWESRRRRKSIGSAASQIVCGTEEGLRRCLAHRHLSPGTEPVPNPAEDTHTDMKGLERLNQRASSSYRKQLCRRGTELGLGKGEQARPRCHPHDVARCHREATSSLTGQSRRQGRRVRRQVKAIDFEVVIGRQRGSVYAAETGREAAP